MTRPNLFMLPCVTLTPLAGALGAVADERLHRGFSAWLSLCRQGRLDPVRAVLLQAELMPIALGAMLAFALVGTLAVWSLHVRAPGARVMLAAHVGCLIAVIAGTLLCPLLFGGLRSTPLALGGMALLEMGVTTLAALALLPLLQRVPAKSLRSMASPIAR
jgi:hypothetical protein